MRVGIDLDGVCYDFSASVREYLVTHAATHTHADTPHPTRWEFYEDWGLDLDGFLATCHDGVDAGIVFAHGEPYWLDCHGLPFDSLTFSADKTVSR